MELKQGLPQISFEILALSKDLIVIDKPAGQLSVPARFADDPRPCVGSLLQKELGQQIFPVHRLDFEVSGPLIFALNREAHRLASLWFERETIHKTYQAWAEGAGEVSDQVQLWESRLVKGKKRTFEADYGKPSRTQARCLKNQTFQNRNFSLWELSPLTGRSHQLRFEMQKRVAPIWGDALYGSKAPYPRSNEMALKCVALNLESVENCLGLPRKIEKSPQFPL